MTKTVHIYSVIIWMADNENSKKNTFFNFCIFDESKWTQYEFFFQITNKMLSDKKAFPLKCNVFALMFSFKNVNEPNESVRNGKFI